MNGVLRLSSRLTANEAQSEGKYLDQKKSHEVINTKKKLNFFTKFCVLRVFVG